MKENRMSSNLWITIAFIVYLSGMLAVGVYFFFRSRSISDFYLGGRKLNKWVTAVSAQASDMSGWLLLGLPGAAYAAGLADSLWIAVGLGVGTYLNWRYVALRLRHYTLIAGNAITIPDYFENRFQDRSHALRMVAALIILVFFLIYTASGFVAGAKLFNTVFGLPYQWALLLGVGVILTYTFLGGFMAVCWTDLFQGVLMLAAIIIVPIAGVVRMGGVAPIHAALEAAGKAHMFDLLTYADGAKSVGVIAMLSTLGWGLGYVGMPHILVRFMAIQHPGEVAQARRIAMVWVVLALSAAVLIGCVGAAFVPGLADSERVFMEMVRALFPAFIAGILLSAILAAIMSTADSQLLVAASALSGDIYHALFRKQAGDRELLWVSRGAVMVIAVIAYFMARDPNSSVFGLVSYAWAGFGAAFGPVVLASLFVRRTTRAGALTGMILGGATVVLWKNYMGHTGLYEIFPGFVAGALGVSIVSYFGGSRDDAVTEQFDRVMHHYEHHGHRDWSTAQDGAGSASARG
jgi:sodium/proline symporter